MESALVQPNPWMILPFGLLLAVIALGPLFFAKWWLKHYPKVALGLGAITVGYYLFGFAGHERALAHHSILEKGEEYLKFIVLIGSLFVVSGGIHINVKGQAAPRANVLFLLTGAVLANVLGTTGASMLLIRPWIRMNRQRIGAHHIVFFIFIVSNVGGCLTPIGDPPLFLGYLRGVPFWWVAEQCLPMWALGVGVLLAMFYAVDRFHLARAPGAADELAPADDRWRFEGWHNVFFLAVILGAVFIAHPLFVREALMAGAAAGSWFTTKKAVHEANQFDFHPIQEVAILFIGIFATMMPALDWLGGNAGTLLGANPSPGLFYWGCGLLSGVLDNAPTYLSFLSASFGTFLNPEVITQVQAHLTSGAVDFNNLTGDYALPVRQTLEALQKYHAADVATNSVSLDEIKVCFLLGNVTFNHYLLAISIGAVFFGAATYIGNGPNFMVKSIAQRQKVPVPNFPGYIFKYALPFLLPVLLLIGWLFFRR